MWRWRTGGQTEGRNTHQWTIAVTPENVRKRVTSRVSAFVNRSMIPIQIENALRPAEKERPWV